MYACLHVCVNMRVCMCVHACREVGGWEQVGRQIGKKIGK